jgi:basic amino acid/polyamine antiporter, APA family
MGIDRDVGLIRTVGARSLAASFICAVIGGGIFALPAALAASVGAYAPVAILICAVAVGCIVICLAEAGSRVASSGGVYGGIHAALGPLAGYISGMLFCVGNVLASGGIAAALADVVANVAPAPLKAAVHVLVIVGVVGGIALVNVSGTGRAMRLVSMMTLLKLAPLVIFIVIGAASVHTGNYVPSGAIHPERFGRALILALFAFTGVETGLCASGEVQNPARNIPRALAIALCAITLLYAGIQVVAQGILGASLAHSTVPLADAMARISPVLRILMLVGAAVSMFGYLVADILGSPRMLFAFARDGLLPGALGRLHARSNVPHVAIICYALIAMMLALTGTFAELAVLATLTSAALYVLGCAAAFFILRGGVTESGRPFNFKGLLPAAVIGIGCMLAAIALASQEEIIGLVALVVVCVIGYWLQTRAAITQA